MAMWIYIMSSLRVHGNRKKYIGHKCIKVGDAIEILDAACLRRIWLNPTMLNWMGWVVHPQPMGIFLCARTGNPCDMERQVWSSQYISEDHWCLWGDFFHTLGPTVKHWKATIAEWAEIYNGMADEKQCHNSCPIFPLRGCNCPNRSNSPFYSALFFGFEQMICHQILHPTREQYKSNYVFLTRLSL